MAKKPILLGYDENGRPMYGLPSQAPDPEMAPVRNGRNVFNKDDYGNYDKERNGRNVTDGKANLGLAGAKTVQYGAAVDTKDKSLVETPSAAMRSSSPRSQGDASDGKPEMLVDYTKDPTKTTVPGQPGYDAKKDPFRERTAEEKAADAKKAAADKKQADLLARHPLGEWWQQKRGEKTNGSGLAAVHLDKWEADKLKNELEQQRASQEFFYPGAKGRSHSSGGTNLGEPEFGGSGGGAFFNGANEWEMASGAVVGQNGIELVSVLDTWNIYNGQ